MATFTDDFTGNTPAADLTTSASADIGGTPFSPAWQNYTGGSSGDCKFSAADGLIRCGVSGLCNYFTKATPTSADYEVAADIYLRAHTDSSPSVLMFARTNLAVSTYYGANLVWTSSTNVAIQLVSSVSGQIGSDVNVTVVEGNSYTGSNNLKLRCTGTTIQVDFLGSNRISVTNSDVSTAGLGGVQLALTTVGSGNNIELGTYTQTNVNAAASLTPGTISADIASGTSVTVTTTAATGGTGTVHYQLKKAPDVAGSPGSYSNQGSSQTTTTPFSVTGLTTRVKVWFKVVNTDDNGSTDSNEVAIYPAVATDYYISGGGSDSNNGTSTGTPWQHVSHGSAGNFNQWWGDTYNLDFSSAPTPGDGLIIVIPSYQPVPTVYSPIVVRAYNNTGTQRATLQVNSDSSHGVQILDQELVTVQNIKILGPGNSGALPDVSSYGTHSGIQVKSLGIGSSRLRSIYFDNVEASGFRSAALIVTRSFFDDAGTPFYLDNGSTTSSHPVGYDDIVFTNCELHDAVSNGLLTFGGGTDGGGAVDWMADYDTFTGIQFIGGQVYDIYGMPDEAAGAPNIVAFLNCTGFQFIRSLIANSGNFASENVGTSTTGPGGIVTGYARYGTIAWNEVYEIRTNGATADGLAIDLDGASQFIQAYNNFTHDNDGSGLVIQDVTSFADFTIGNVIRYNKSYNDGQLNYGSMLIKMLNGQTSNIFHNNAGYRNASACAGSLPLLARIDGDAQFVNNIWQTTGNLAIVGTGFTTDSIFLGNIYYPTGGTLSINGDASLAAFQANGFETYGIQIFGLTSDPLLLGPLGSTAFTPLLPALQVGTLTTLDIPSNSPAVGAGINPYLLGFNPGGFDWHGFPNYVDGWDIGAMTYNGRSLVPITGSSGTGSIFGSPIIRAR